MFVKFKRIYFHLKRWQKSLYIYVHCTHTQSLNCVWLFATTQTVTHQAPLSMEFSRQEYWNRRPLPSPEDLPNPGIKPMSLISPALAGRFFITVHWALFLSYLLFQWKDFYCVPIVIRIPVPSFPHPFVKHIQSCPTLCDPMDASPLGSFVHGILQARILQCIAISFSRGHSWLKDQTLVSCVSYTGRPVLYQLSHEGSPTPRGIFKYLQSVSAHFESRPSYKRPWIVV